MREIRQSGSVGGGALITLSLPLSTRQCSERPPGQAAGFGTAFYHHAGAALTPRVADLCTFC